MKKQNNILTWIIIAVLAVLLFNGFGMMYGFGWFFMFLIVIALVLFIAWLIKELQDKK